MVNFIQMLDFILFYLKIILFNNPSTKYLLFVKYVPRTMVSAEAAAMNVF